MRADATTRPQAESERERESLTTAVVECSRRHSAGDITRARLDARLIELRTRPDLRRRRSRSLPSPPPPVTFHSLEHVTAAEEAR